MKARKIVASVKYDFCQTCHVVGSEELIEVDVIVPSAGFVTEQKILICDECVDELWSFKNSD